MCLPSGLNCATPLNAAPSARPGTSAIAASPMRRPDVMSHARKRTASASIATATRSVRGNVERAGYEVVVARGPYRAARRRVAREEPADRFVRRGDDGGTVRTQLCVPDPAGHALRCLDHDSGLVQRVRIAHLSAGGEALRTNAWRPSAEYATLCTSGATGCAIKPAASLSPQSPMRPSSATETR